MLRRPLLFALALLLMTSVLLGGPHDRWENDIAAFEARDREHPPTPGGILFAGSSSIVGWDTDKHFPEMKVVNRGFGGSEIADSTHFAPRFIHPHQPNIVVLYAGDNDLANGKTPEQVLKDFEAFVTAVREGAADAQVVFIAIKPSTARWALVDQIRQANAAVRTRCDEDDGLHFADIFHPTLNEAGEPEAAYLADDGLHLTPAGYEKWTSIVRPILDDILDPRNEE